MECDFSPGSWITIAVALGWVLPLIAAIIAGVEKGKGVTGFLLGLFLGWIGLLILVNLPDSKDLERTKTWAEKQRTEKWAEKQDREYQERKAKREQENREATERIAAAKREQENRERITAAEREYEQKVRMAKKREQVNRNMLASVSGGREVIKVRCPKCGALMNEWIKFCSECGTPMEVRCYKCGALINEGVKFCSECGAPM